MSLIQSKFQPLSLVDLTINCIIANSTRFSLSNIPEELAYLIIKHSFLENTLAPSEIARFFLEKKICEINFQGIEKIGLSRFWLFISQKLPLQILKLDGCHFIGNREVHAISLNCPDLASLSLWNCQRISTVAIRSLEKGCLLLKELRIETEANYSCTLFGRTAYSPLNGFGNLIFLEISIQKLTFKIFKDFLMFHPFLRRLNILTRETSQLENIEREIKNHSEIDVKIFLEDSNSILESNQIGIPFKKTWLNEINFALLDIQTPYVHWLFTSYKHYVPFLVKFLNEMIMHHYPDKLLIYLDYMRLMSDFDFRVWGKYFNFLHPFLGHSSKKPFNIIFIEFLLELSKNHEFEKCLKQFQKGRWESSQPIYRIHFQAFESSKNQNYYRFFLDLLSLTDLKLYAIEIFESLLKVFKMEVVIEIILMISLKQLKSLLEGLMNRASISMSILNILIELEKMLLDDTEKRKLLHGALSIMHHE